MSASGYLEFYCLEVEGTDNYEGWFTSKELLKEYYEACVKAYPRIRHTPVKIHLQVNYDWKNDLLDGGTPKSLFPHRVSEITF